MAILRSPETEKALDPTAMESKASKNISDPNYITIPVYEYRDLTRCSLLIDSIIGIFTSGISQYQQTDCVKVLLGLDSKEDKA